MKKQRKHYTPEEKVAILRRHLLEKEPISKLCRLRFSSRQIGRDSAGHGSVYGRRRGGRGVSTPFADQPPGDPPVTSEPRAFSVNLAVDKPTSGLLIIPESDFRYSLLSASTGSTRIARRAGIAVAMRTTTRRMIEPQPSVHGSKAETSYSIPARISRAAKAPANPRPTPSRPTVMPWRRTSQRTSAALAPSATRTPSSCVRCATRYDTTP